MRRSTRTVTCRLALIAGFAFPSAVAHADDEISLFDGSGQATAYIAPDDEMTIYLWSGKPVAYLDANEGSDQFNVYGFNGKHLGWFSHGAIWDHSGHAECATAQRLSSTQIEPVKAIKQIAPIRAIPEIAPISPIFINSFGGLSCIGILALGAE
jgi:hypothetical protein